MLGPIPKTGCGVRALLTSPFPASTCFWLKLLPAPCPLSPGHGGSGTYLISPGMIPALDAWPLPAQATSPAWKNPHQTRPICPWRVESGRAGGLGWGGGGHGAHGHPVLSPVPDTTGPDTGDSTISGAHPSSQIAPSSLGGGVADAAQSWRHVALFLAKCEVGGWVQGPVRPWSTFSLCVRHLTLTRQAVEPLPMHVHHA